MGQAALILALTASAMAHGAGAAPLRVASLNMCTDELLLALGEPSQVSSVTHLSHQPAEVPWWREARQFPRNGGSLLSVASMKPNLVLAMGGGVRDRTGIAARLKIRTLDLPYPFTFHDVKLNVARVAVALGREEQGRALLMRMEKLRRSTPSDAKDGIWLGGGGRSVAATGLAAEWMALAGLRQRPLLGDRVSLEQLAASPPVVLLRSDYRAGQFSGEQRWLSHPLAGRALNVPTLVTDGRYWTCMGPSLISEIDRLRKAVTR